jgi:hypothetical protein
MNRNAKWAILASTTEITKRVPDHVGQKTPFAPSSPNLLTTKLTACALPVDGSDGRLAILVKSGRFSSKQLTSRQSKTPSVLADGVVVFQTFSFQYPSSGAS